MWDMTNKRRINSTFNPYFEDWWTGGSDDPGLASGLFLAEKNVYRPQEKELQVLNLFVEDFIIKRLTEQPGWRVHRMVPWYTMFEPWAGRGADDVWRAFNYVHVINLSLIHIYRWHGEHAKGKWCNRVGQCIFNRQKQKNCGIIRIITMEYDNK